MQWPVEFQDFQDKMFRSVLQSLHPRDSRKANYQYHRRYLKLSLTNQVLVPLPLIKAIIQLALQLSLQLTWYRRFHILLHSLSTTDISCATGSSLLEAVSWGLHKTDLATRLHLGHAQVTQRSPTGASSDGRKRMEKCPACKHTWLPTSRLLTYLLNMHLTHLSSWFTSQETAVPSWKATKQRVSMIRTFQYCWSSNLCILLEFVRRLQNKVTDIVRLLAGCCNRKRLEERRDESDGWKDPHERKSYRRPA